MRTMLKLLLLGALAAVAATLAGPLSLAADRDAPAVALWQGDDAKAATNEPSEAELASDLARLEVYVGIRVEQMNAWRDYTAALQELLAPRRKPEDRHEQPPFDPPGPKDPFDREQKLADEFSRRGQAAERLETAIAALRMTLTPAQLDRLAWAGRSKWLRIPQGPFGKTQGDE